MSDKKWFTENSNILYSSGLIDDDKDFQKFLLTLWSKELHTELKKLIKGEIKIRISENDIIVRIYGCNTMVFDYKISNIKEEINKGWTVSMLAYNISKSYRSYINFLYFQ